MFSSLLNHHRLKPVLFVSVVIILTTASLHARLREPPLISIHQIKPWMSFSKVRIEGVLESRSLEMRDGSLLWMVADETGSLPVFTDQALRVHGLDSGVAVVVEGRLGLVSSDRVSLHIDEVEGFNVLSESVPVTVRGMIAEVHSPPFGSRHPHRLMLERPEGRIEVIHWFSPEKQVAVGDTVEATGTLVFYKGKKQVKVNHRGRLKHYCEG